MLQMLASLETLEVRKTHTVTMIMGKKDVCKCEYRKMTQLSEKKGAFYNMRGIFEPHDIDSLNCAIKHAAGRQ